MHYATKKTNLFLARLPGIAANSNEIIDVITARLSLIFLEISSNIEFPENSQP